MCKLEIGMEKQKLLGTRRYCFSDLRRAKLEACRNAAEAAQGFAEMGIRTGDELTETKNIIATSSLVLPTGFPSPLRNTCKKSQEELHCFLRTPCIQHARCHWTGSLQEAWPFSTLAASISFPLQVRYLTICYAVWSFCKGVPCNPLGFCAKIKWSEINQPGFPVKATSISTICDWE